MTNKFLCDSGFGLTESVIMPRQYNRIDVLESAVGAIRDGITTDFITETAGSYANSLISEILDSVKKKLLELVQQVLTVINNVHINSIRLMDKYQEVLVERLKHLDDQVVHETFEYKSYYDYPTVIKANAVESEIASLQKLIAEENVTADQIGRRVDNMLADFGKTTCRKNIKLYDIAGSVKSNVIDAIRGKPKTVYIDADSIRDYISTIKSYKGDRDDVIKTKKAIIEDYEALKRLHMKATEDPIATMKGTIQYQLDPDKEDFLAREYNRYADIHVEMLRLFNGYITIYNTAFDTKLQIMMEKFNDRKEFITKLFSVTGIFSALNTKMAKDPIQFNTRGTVKRDGEG